MTTTTFRRGQFSEQRTPSASTRHVTMVPASYGRNQTCTSPYCKDPSCEVPPNLLYCSVVSADAESSDDESGNPMVFYERHRPSVTSLVPQKPRFNWKEQILQVSNIASALCVIDCTLLPALTILLPLLGVVASTTGWSHWLHEAGHLMALTFVVPVGLMATTTNYLLSHRTKWIAVLGLCAVLLIGMANAGCALSHAVEDVVPGILGYYLHKLLHAVHHGLAHRIANLVGCALLMTSNYFSRKRGGCVNNCACER